MKQTKEPNIQWHPAFAAAMQLTLREEKKYLEFQREYNLSLKPLQIDLLIIRKFSSAPLTNPIASFFLGHNLMEYKSPEDELNEDTWCKVLAYAYLYKSLEPHVDVIRLNDITISLVRNGKPHKLFKYLKKQGYAMTCPQHGIYRFTKDGFFPAQILVLNELGRQGYLWLSALRSDLRQADAQNLINAARQLHEKDDRDHADSVLDFSLKANRELFAAMKNKEGKTMWEALKELMAPEIKELEQTAVEQGLERGLEQGLERGLEQGLEQGLRQGRLESLRQSVKNAFAAGADFSLVQQIAPSLSEEELRNIQAEVVSGVTE